MDICLAVEHACYLTPQYTVEVARDRVEQKKASLVAGTVGALFSRPKPEEIRMVSVESRLEPFWHIAMRSRTRYDRNRTFVVPASGPEVVQVSLLEHQVNVDPKAKGGPALVLTGIEHCVEEHRALKHLDAVSGEVVDRTKHLAVLRNEIPDLAEFTPGGTIVVHPQLRASAVIRQLMSEVVKPVQNAQVLHEERVEVEVLDLVFRPVYGFEYEWAAKGKKAIIEFDAITGDFEAGGKKWSDQVKGVLSRELLFDVTAEAAGLLVPGGHIAVKLIKAVVDNNK